MELHASISWDQGLDFESARLFDIILRIENGEPQKFKGQLKRPDTTLYYLWNLYVGATQDYKKGKAYVGEIVHTTDGNRVYKIPITVKEKELEKLNHIARRIETKHFIPTRNELVSDEEYCAFFGSSGNLWDIDTCDYPPGSFIETLRQTVHDMENGQPHIYRWTNVPRWDKLEELTLDYSDLERFVETKLKPLSDDLESQFRSSRNIEKIKDWYTAVADAAEKYGKENGIEKI